MAMLAVPAMFDPSAQPPSAILAVPDVLEWSAPKPLPVFQARAFVDEKQGEVNRRLGVLCLLYARRRSFWLDVRLILLSFAVTFTGRWERREGKVSRRRQRRYRKPASPGPVWSAEAPLPRGPSE